MGDIKIFILAGILKVLAILMLVNVAIFGNECMFMLKLLWGLLADSISLMRIGLDSSVGVKGSSFCDEFEDMSFLHGNKIK